MALIIELATNVIRKVTLSVIVGKQEEMDTTNRRTATMEKTTVAPVEETMVQLRSSTPIPPLKNPSNKSHLSLLSLPGLSSDEQKEADPVLLTLMSPQLCMTLVLSMDPNTIRPMAEAVNVEKAEVEAAAVDEDVVVAVVVMAESMETTEKTLVRKMLHQPQPRKFRLSLSRAIGLTKAATTFRLKFKIRPAGKPSWQPRKCHKNDILTVDYLLLIRSSKGL
jgi:hypothetical protein